MAIEKHLTLVLMHPLNSATLVYNRAMARTEVPSAPQDLTQKFLNNRTTRAGGRLKRDEVAKFS